VWEAGDRRAAGIGLAVPPGKLVSAVLAHNVRLRLSGRPRDIGPGHIRTVRPGEKRMGQRGLPPFILVSLSKRHPESFAIYDRLIRGDGRVVHISNGLVLAVIVGLVGVGLIT